MELDNFNLGITAMGPIVSNRFSTQVFIFLFLEVIFEEEWLESILRFLTMCIRG
jgi:hypothetical protein